MMADFDATAIRERLDKSISDINIKVYAVAGSTNALALDYAARGGACPAIFIAEEQTSGRGRLGRSFISPRGGLYMTILTESLDGTNPTAYTAYAAVAAKRAIQRATSAETKIKWVNDLYLGGKKLSGILAQGYVNPSSGRVTHIAMGIGINLSGRLPDEIRDIATSLEAEGYEADRLRLTVAIINEYLLHIRGVGTPECAEEYRRHSFLIGKEVRVIKTIGEYTATVTDVSDRCELILSLPDGQCEYLSTGEVSVREKL